MEQRDFITREIARIGQVLGKLLARLAGIDSPGGALEIGLGESRQVLREELNLDLEELMKRSDTEVIERLTEGLRFTPEHLDSLLELLVGLANNPLTEANDRKGLLRLVKIIANYLEGELQLLSFNRTLLLSRIQER